MLVHHAESGGYRVGRRCEGAGPAVDRDAARVGAQVAERDVEERRLPRPVLAEQRVQRAAWNDERGVAEGDRRSESFHDVSELEGRGHVGRGQVGRGHVDMTPVMRARLAAHRRLVGGRRRRRRPTQSPVGAPMKLHGSS